MICPLTPGQQQEEQQVQTGEEGQGDLLQQEQNQADLRAALCSDLQEDRRHDEDEELRGHTGEEEEDSRSWISVQAGPTETDRERQEETRPEEEREETLGGERRS